MESKSAAAASSSSSSCWGTLARGPRLRRIFIGLMALGYVAITSAIYRNISILVHNTDFLTTGSIPTYLIALQSSPTIESTTNDASLLIEYDYLNASHQDAPLNMTTITPTAQSPSNSGKRDTAPLIPTTQIHEQNASASGIPKTKKASFKFFMLSIPELTSDLLATHWDKAYVYGKKAMNEDLAEIWLHRGLSNFTYEQGRTMDPNEADVFFIPAYLHGRDSWIKGPTTDQNRKEIVTIIMNALIDKTKPHVLLIPTRDKTLGSRIGYRLVAQTLWDQGIIPLYSVGFERNSWWQVIPTHRIIPIPYVVKPLVSAHDMPVIMFDQANRTENFVFYAADPRPSAVSFAGCNRSTVLPLQGQENMEIMLLPQNQRLSQERYNHRMLTSDYCLVTCGDTPTTRSLASAMVAGCIPLRIGSWWRAICEAPCKKIHMGFNVATKPHFPFVNEIDWSLFPELNETTFANDPVQTLAIFIQNTSRAQKDAMRVAMKRVQSSWIYGWGNPMNSTQFGDVYKYLWNSIIHELGL